MRFLVSLAAILSIAQAVTIPGLLGRTSQDTCGSLVNAALKVSVSSLQPVAIGVINACLCLSGIPNFMNTNIVAIAAVRVAGQAATTNALSSLVLNAGKQCTYPDGSLPQCSPSSPCGFTCSNGFTPSGGTCECKTPNRICNGICSNAANCPSSTPEKRRADGSWQKRTSCDVGFTACGTTSSYRKSLGAYECVDTQNDLESCGGCNIPLHEHSSRGQDCSSIPGVADVSCYNGACRVYECMPGHTISFDQSTCHSEGQLKIIKELIENPYKMAVDLL